MAISSRYYRDSQVPRSLRSIVAEPMPSSEATKEMEGEGYESRGDEVDDKRWSKEKLQKGIRRDSAEVMDRGQEARVMDRLLTSYRHLAPIPLFF